MKNPKTKTMKLKLKNMKLKTNLSASALLLMRGETALAGEKLGLYKPDMESTERKGGK